MSLHYEDKGLRIVKVPHMGPIDNNGYILSCQETGEAVIIDAPAEPEKLLKEIGDVKVKAIIITHRHGDHTAGLLEMKNHTGVPVVAHVDDAPALPITPDLQLKDGDSYQIGKIQLLALHTPGHTPGALCLLTGNHLFSGDTLFPGGPGRTGSPETFQQVKDSITRQLLPLSDEIAVYPGHGIDTTIGEARERIQVFNSKSHPADLCGDVEWLKS
jgi:glyoxylase-like metal-dependent hydrolase (beta-lactamase superfamily II)